MALLNITDIASIGIVLVFVVALAQMAPIHNEGSLTDIGTTSDSKAGGSPVPVAMGELAPVSGIRTRSPLSACGMPQGVGISSRLLPPANGPTFDDAEFTQLDAQGIVAKNYLTATSRIGYPTNSTSRCKNQQLRSEPVVTRSVNINNVPWGVSPITSDHQIQRPFELQTVEPTLYMQETKKDAMGK